MIETPRSARVEFILASLRQRADELKIFKSCDDRVGESDAARLLDVHVDTLAKKRLAGTGPAFFDRPLRRAKITYSITDLALWIVDGRELIGAD